MKMDRGALHEMTGELITATIANFCAISDIGRSKVYELLDAGDLDSIKIGKRRLIVLASYHELIAQQRAASATTTPGPGKQSSSRQPIDAADAMAGGCGGTDAANILDDVNDAAEEFLAGTSPERQKPGHPHPSLAGKGTPIDSAAYRARNKLARKSSARTLVGGGEVSL